MIASRIIRAAFVTVALAAITGTASAQRVRQLDPNAPPEMPVRDFSDFLFPPELVMHFQEKINLKPDQRATITTAIQQLQSSVVPIQWEMQSVAQKLNEVVQGTSIKEAEALALVDRILQLEREVKRNHLSTLIRIKNTLTSDQVVQLDSLQRAWQAAAPRASNIRGRAYNTPPEGATKVPPSTTKTPGTVTKRP